jgi:predicted dehydrogenase
MTNKKLNIGLAGCGHLGKIHCRLLNEIVRENSSVFFSGVYDIDISKSEKLSRENNVKCYASLEEMFDKINTLIIVSSTSAHFPIAQMALRKDINLFIEKPVTESHTEAVKLLGLAQDKNIKIQIGHVERFNPALASLAGYRIEPMFIESHRLAQFNPRGTDVSVIQDLMIHDLDIILHFVKSPIRDIQANGVKVISGSTDIANARISFENGCVANITSSRISLKKMRKMRIFQPDTYISIDFLNNKSEVFTLIDSKTEHSASMSFPLNENKKIIYLQPETQMNEEINPIKEELKVFFDCILNNTEPAVTLEEGIAALEVADKINNLIIHS